MEAVGPHVDDWKRPKRRLNDCFTFAANASCADSHLSPSSEDAPVCWICLDGPRPEACLLQPCKCPRFAHAHCLARWQLQSAGSRKETHCEFCDGTLPDWKATLTPTCGANAPAVMNVNFDGRTYSFEVKPGADGYRRFTEAIRRAFTLPDDSELNITFTCDEPSTVPFVEPVVAPVVSGLTHMGSLLTLQGAGAYDAAVHCASVSAARRILHSHASSCASSSPGTSPMHPSGDSSSRAGGFSGGFGPGPTNEPPVRAVPFVGEERREIRKRRFQGVANKLRLAISDLINPGKSNHHGSHPPQ